MRGCLKKFSSRKKISTSGNIERLFVQLFGANQLIRNLHILNSTFQWFPPTVGANSCTNCCVVYCGFKRLFAFVVFEGWGEWENSHIASSISPALTTEQYFHLNSMAIPN